MNRRDFHLGVISGLSSLAAVRLVPFADALAALFSAAAPLAQPARPTQPPLRVNGERLAEQVRTLAEFGKTPTGTDRVAYSDADKVGREYVMRLMREARLEPAVDAAGNIIGRRRGRVASTKPILFGSHIDTVPDGGNYDGVVGSLSAIEVARTLADNRVATRQPLEVVIWQNEEGGLVGSRAAIGLLGERDLAQTSRSGKTIREGIAFIGGDPARLTSARREPGSITAYLELHIEQGAVLDRENVDIGIVEGIVGIGWWDVTVEGFANHAGTTPMDQRRDALLAAAKFVEMVNRVVTAEPGRQVGTVGRIQAFPGAPNVIPGRVVTSLEIRDLEAAKIARLYEAVRREAERIGRESGTTFSFAESFGSEPALADARIKGIIEESTRELGLSTRRMASGAGHDAQDMARLGPMGMIFVPSVGGISHSPRELTRPEDIENGANVLLGVVSRLGRG